MINLDRLVTWLNQSTLAQTNNPLYQLLKTLIQAAQEFQSEQEAINTASGGAIVTLSDLDFLTHSDESIVLPNSRQLIAGINVTFDDTVVNQRTVNVLAAGPQWSVLTDGDLIEPELIFAGGDVIMTHIP